MQTILKIILVLSILVNLVAIWGFFHYVRYGGSPLGELKRMLTGGNEQVAPSIPYSAENAAMLQQLADSTAAPDRVVFLGASITNRWDFTRYFPRFNMVNRGVGGQLVPSMLARYKRDVLDLKPKAAIIKYCSINIRPRLPLSVLRDAMTMMTTLAKQHDIIPIVSTIIPPGKPEAHIGDFSVIDSLNKFNDWVRGFASEHNVHLIDFAKAIEDSEGFLPRDCSTDPVHVNEKGYAILAEAAIPVIEAVVKE